MNENNQDNINIELNTLEFYVKRLVNRVASDKKDVLNSTGMVSTYKQSGWDASFQSLANNTPWNLITNNQVLLDMVYSQNGMVKKMLDTITNGAFKLPPMLQTTLIEADDLKVLQDIFNEFFNEYRNSQKQVALYGGAFLVLSYGKTKADLFNFEDKYLQDIQEGDIVNLNVFSPWQILHLQQYNTEYINSINILTNTKQTSAFDDFILTQKENVKQCEDADVIDASCPYSFTSLAGRLKGGKIHNSLVIPLKNDVFVPYYTGMRLINRWAGFSFLESIDEDLKRYEKIIAMTEKLLEVPLIRQVQVPDLAKMAMTTQGASKIRETTQLIKSFAEDGMAVTDEGVNFSQMQTSYSGLTDIITFFKNSLIEKAGIPLNIWNGEGASGLNATGEDVDKQWTERIITEQNKSKNVLLFLARVLGKAKFGIDLTDLQIEYHNVYNETEETKQAKKDAIIKNLTDIQGIVGGRLSKDKALQIINQAKVFDIDIELEDVNEEQQPQDNAQSFLNIVND